MFDLKSLITEHQPKNGSFYLIAIDGRGGSGKSTLLEYIKTVLPDFVFLNGDDYFEPADNGVAWGRFNEKRFEEDLISQLRQARREFIYRPFDWHKVPHISEKQISISHGLILERGYSFTFNLEYDLRIWVNTPKEVCFKRGVGRDHMQKGKEVKAWQVWQSHEDEYIDEFQPEKLADLIIDGTVPFSEQLK